MITGGGGGKVPSESFMALSDTKIINESKYNSLNTYVHGSPKGTTFLILRRSIPRFAFPNVGDKKVVQDGFTASS